MRFAFVSDHSALFEVSIVLCVLNVNKSGFCAWLKRFVCPRAERSAVVLEGFLAGTAWLGNSEQRGPSTDSSSEPLKGGL